MTNLLICGYRMFCCEKKIVQHIMEDKSATCWKKNTVKPFIFASFAFAKWNMEKFN